MAIYSTLLLKFMFQLPKPPKHQGNVASPKHSPKGHDSDQRCPSTVDFQDLSLIQTPQGEIRIMENILETIGMFRGL